MVSQDLTVVGAADLLTRSISSQVGSHHNLDYICKIQPLTFDLPASPELQPWAGGLGGRPDVSRPPIKEEPGFFFQPEVRDSDTQHFAYWTMRQCDPPNPPIHSFMYYWNNKAHSLLLYSSLSYDFTLHVLMDVQWLCGEDRLIPGRLSFETLSPAKVRVQTISDSLQWFFFTSLPTWVDPMCCRLPKTQSYHSSYQQGPLSVSTWRE